MGLSASQGRLLLLTARRSDLEFRAQQISQKRLMLAQELESIALDYEKATTNKQMKIQLYLDGSKENKESQQTVNLTYARLVSGAIAAGMAKSGIRSSRAAGTEDLEYSSTQAYRLTDANGNIVVSSEDEIPASGQKICVAKYTAEGANGEATALHKALNPTNGRSIDAFASASSAQYVKVGSNFYDVNSGLQVTDSANLRTLNSKTWDSLATMEKADGTNRPGVSSVTKTQLQGPSSEGVYKLFDPTSGEILNTYVVDEALKAGGSEPNYLQDAIRYGRYSIQKGGIDGDTNDYKWSNLSWESMTNLYDYKYTDDDEAAQMKHDRLQAEIQNEDKLLEVELDNIETQRSAVTTEIESVQKVIDDNIESTFKIFS